MKHLHGGFNNEYAKQWKVELFEVNGIDSTSYFKKGKSYSRFGYYDVEISRLNKEDKSFILATEVVKFNMRLIDKKKVLMITPGKVPMFGSENCYQNNQVCERNIFMPYRVFDHTFEWKIRKLTNNELIITLAGSNSYKIKLRYAK